MSRTRQLNDAEREERRARDRERLKEAAEQLLTSEGWRRWVHVRSRNGLARYSVNNQLLIALACPDATFVAGFRAWLDLGYCVRKGEKAIRILAPMALKPRDDEDDEPKVVFRSVAVFDRQHVDPLDGVEPAPLEPPCEALTGASHVHLIEPLVSFADSLGFTVSFATIPGSAGGYCDAKAKRIVVDDQSPANRAGAHLGPRARPRARGRLPRVLARPGRGDRRHRHVHRLRRRGTRRQRRVDPLRRRLGRVRRA